MKQNKIFRLSAILLVLTLLSTCVISGTFAKYTTSDDASDTARVAKWGVEIAANASVVTVLDTQDSNPEGHVKAETPKVVLAPGTKTTELADFTITGTPEVAVNVNYVANLSLTGWEVVGNGYYCPLEITVNGTVFKGNSYASADLFEAAVEAAIAGLSDNYAAEYDMSSVLAPHVTVAWGFIGNDDVKDTALGNQASEGNVAEVSLTITCTITQID